MACKTDQHSLSLLHDAYEFSQENPSAGVIQTMGKHEETSSLVGPVPGLRAGLTDPSSGASRWPWRLTACWLRLEGEQLERKCPEWMRVRKTRQKRMA